MRNGIKKWGIGCALVCFVSLQVLAQSGSGEYQSGKIIKVTQLPYKGSSGGTDAPLSSKIYDYDVSIQIGDQIYVCHYHAHEAQEMSWLQDKEGQVRIKGKVMYVKRATGKDARANIIRTSKAE